MAENTDSSETVATITKLTLVNEGTIKAHVTYTVNTQYPNGQTSVAVRRYNDFAWLQKELEQKHPDILVPPIPEKDALSRFFTDVVQYRRREFNRFLGRISSHPVLSKDKSVELFLTAKEDELNSHQEESSGFFQNMLSTVTNIPQIATELISEVEEKDKWFETQESYMEDLGRDLALLKKATNANTKQKNERITTAVTLGERIHLCAELEQEKKEKKLSVYLSKFSEVILQIASLDQTIVKNETEMFEDAIMDQQRLSTSSKRILVTRQNTLLQYQLSAADAKSKAEKANNSASTEKLALEKKEAEDKEEESRKRYQETSDKVRTQVSDYTKNKTILMHWALRELARENIEYGEQVIALWKELGKTLEH